MGGDDSYEKGVGSNYKPMPDPATATDDRALAREYLNEQSSTCGRVTSAFFALTTIFLAGLAIVWADRDGPTGVDCGEQNPLNVSYFNWLILLGVSLGSVFLMQLLVALLSFAPSRSRRSSCLTGRNRCAAAANCS